MKDRDRLLPRLSEIPKTETIIDRTYNALQQDPQVFVAGMRVDTSGEFGWKAFASISIGPVTPMYDLNLLNEFTKQLAEKYDHGPINDLQFAREEVWSNTGTGKPLYRDEFKFPYLQFSEGNYGSLNDDEANPPYRASVAIYPSAAIAQLVHIVENHPNKTDVMGAQSAFALLGMGLTASRGERAVSIRHNMPLPHFRVLASYLDATAEQIGGFLIAAYQNSQPENVLKDHKMPMTRELALSVAQRPNFLSGIKSRLRLKGK